MRVLLVLIAFGMIAVPALLALSQTRRSRGRRIANALAIVLIPALALGLIHGVPELAGRSLDNPNSWTALRLVLTGLALILPWCLYVALAARR